MKSLPLSILALVAVGQSALVHAAIKTQDSSQEAIPHPIPSVIQSYRVVLTRIPADLRETKPAAWTAVQRDAVNSALQQSLIQTGTRARFTLKMKNVADWSGLTLHGELPNREGYMIRVFGKFSEDWKAKLESLNRGDEVTLEGPLNSVTYRELWGRFTLSINLKDCTFTKQSGS